MKLDSPTERVWIVEHARHEFGETMKPRDKQIVGIVNRLKDHRNSCLYNEFVLRYGDAFCLFEHGIDRPIEPL